MTDLYLMTSLHQMTQLLTAGVVVCIQTYMECYHTYIALISSRSGILTSAGKEIRRNGKIAKYT